MSFKEFKRVLAEFSKIDSEMQVPTILCFLYVAENNECLQRDVEVSLGLTNGSASRNISYWTDRRFDRKPGKGFIERFEDNYDRRLRVLRLTPEGKEFFNKLRGENDGSTTTKRQVGS